MSFINNQENIRPKTDIIYEQKKFVDAYGRKISERIPQTDAMKEVEKKLPRFLGTAMVIIGDQYNNPVDQLPVNFQIEADNIQQAFHNYDQAAEEQIPEILQKRQQPNSAILTPQANTQTMLNALNKLKEN